MQRVHRRGCHSEGFIGLIGGSCRGEGFIGFIGGGCRGEGFIGFIGGGCRGEGFIGFIGGGYHCETVEAAAFGEPTALGGRVDGG